MKKKKILIVEDEQISALNMRFLLESLGYDVIEPVMTGKKAINSALDEKPDLIIMDIYLADEIDGITAAREIQKQHNVPTIFISASTDKETISRVNTVNLERFITKPFQPEEIVDIVQKLLS